MNVSNLTGKIVGDIVSEYDKKLTTCKFNVKSFWYNKASSLMESTTIRCICYGALAEYCINELWEGCDIFVSGRLWNRCYRIPSGAKYVTYVVCHMVCKIEQGEYV